MGKLRSKSSKYIGVMLLLLQRRYGRPPFPPNLIPHFTTSIRDTGYQRKEMYVYLRYSPWCLSNIVLP